MEVKTYSSYGAGTVGELWRFLLSPTGNDEPVGPELLREKLLHATDWPPDVFGLVAAVLRRSGAYGRLPRADFAGRNADLQEIAKKWRSAASRKKYAPRKVRRIWTDLQNRLEDPIQRCTRDAACLQNLLDLFIMADRACKGFGLPFDGADGVEGDFPLEYKADAKLVPREFGSTLSNINPAVARVLPKVHTAQAGLTLRSWSHYLCYAEGDEVRPLWYVIPGQMSDVSRLNLLVVPWPFTVSNRQFRDGGPIRSRSEVDSDTRTTSPLAGDQRIKGAAEKQSKELQRHRYFDFEPDDTGGDVVRRILRLCDAARGRVEKVDAVILPELAVGGADYRWLRRELLYRQIMLVAGVGGENQQGRRENRIGLDIPLSASYGVHLRQRKHHPWRVERGQIMQYALGTHLDPSSVYWENLGLGDRHIGFVVLRPWLVTSVLICEDLARREPAGELIRGVGPNLVIALLMDGPQTLRRWSSRYAASLADDPGCSVLAVTSLGMTLRSDPMGSDSQERVVALWRDTKSSCELTLPAGEDALLLMLNVEIKPEWTADLRRKGDYSFFPILSGHLPIRDPGQAANEATRPGEIKSLAPTEASALARLAGLKLNGKATDAYADILQDLRKDGRDIARLLFEMHPPGTAKAGKSVNPGDAELTATDRQRERLLKILYPASMVDPSAELTAKAILDWCTKNREFQKNISDTK